MTNKTHYYIHKSYKDMGFMAFECVSQHFLRTLFHTVRTRRCTSSDFTRAWRKTLGFPLNNTFSVDIIFITNIYFLLQ